MEKKLLKIENPQKITLDYIELGEGKPILFLHGGGTDYTTYSDFLSLLAKKYKVYAFAIPGFGKSSGIKSYTLEKFNILILEFIKSLGLNSIYIVGHSLGGGLAINFAKYEQNSINIEGLALISPWIKKVNKSLPKMLNDLSKQNVLALKEIKNKKVKNNLFKYIINNFFEIKHDINSIKLLNLINKNELTQGLDLLSLPVLGFYGTNDLVIESNDQKEGLELIKGAQIFRLENKGHHLVHTEKEFIVDSISKIY